MQSSNLNFRLKHYLDSDQSDPLVLDHQTVVTKYVAEHSERVCLCINDSIATTIRPRPRLCPRWVWRIVVSRLVVIRCKTEYTEAINP